MPFREGQEVRVKALLEPRHWERHTGKAVRAPTVGDVGLVVDIDASGGKMIYTVECTDANGSERWLTDFGHRKNKLRSGVTSGYGRSVKALRGPGGGNESQLEARERLIPPDSKG